MKIHLFFDLDRTIWDFDVNSKATLSEMYDHFELANRFGFLKDSFIRKYERINKSYWGLYQAGKIDREALRSDRFYKTLQAFGHEDSVLAGTLGSYYLERCPLKTSLIPGAKEMLDHFEGKYPMYLITNGFTETQTLKINGSGISHYFKEMVTSDRAGIQKPSPKIFDFAWRLAGKPDKELCYYIGDDWNADVRGARQFGFTPIWFSTEERKTKILQVRTLSRLMEILG